MARRSSSQLRAKNAAPMASSTAAAFEIEGSILYHKTEYRERRNHYALFSVNTPITAFETDRDSFLSPYRSNQNPSAVEKGQLSNSVASGWSPIAAHQIDLT